MTKDRRGTLSLRAVATVLLALTVSSATLMPGQAYAQMNSRYVKVDDLAAGRVLWIRSGPGLRFKRIGFLPSTARHIRNYGCKQMVTGFWCKVRYRGTRGWASGRFLAADRARRT